MGNNIIVAVDLGATKIAIAAAERKNNGSIKVLALESEPINKGTFSNGLFNRPYDVKGALIKTKQLLNNRLDTLRLNVSSIYTSIGGRSLRSELKDHSKSFDHDTEISQEILERMQEEVYRNNHYKKDVLYIVNQGYTVDGDYKVNPVGNFCLSIIGHYLVVLGNSIIEEGIEKISQQLDVNIEGMQISPICVAKAILTDNDKQKGCCVIDFGASKTGMALYHEGYLKIGRASCRERVLRLV